MIALRNEGVRATPAMLILALRQRPSRLCEVFTVTAEPAAHPVILSELCNRMGDGIV
jgi:hypothetical protein